MEDTWLNPDFAAGQIVVLAVVILASLTVIGVLFGALIYALLGAAERLMKARRTARKRGESSE